MTLTNCPLCEPVSLGKMPLPLSRRDGLWLQLHRHHWRDHGAEIFLLRSSGVKIETVIDGWHPWDAIVLRQLWTSERLILLLQRNFEIWDFLKSCPAGARERIFFSPSARGPLAKEKVIKLLLDVETTFPEVQRKIIPLNQEDLEPASFEWEIERFRQDHRALNSFFKIVHLIYPLRIVLWIALVLLCLLQNSLSGNLRQLQAINRGLHGRAKSLLITAYWIFRRILARAQLWRIPVWAYWTAFSITWRTKLQISYLRMRIFQWITCIHWFQPWYMLKFVVGRYLLKPYYFSKYQYTTRVQPYFAKAVNE